jgi:hypothetical protein
MIEYGLYGFFILINIKIQKNNKKTNNNLSFADLIQLIIKKNYIFHIRDYFKHYRGIRNENIYS